MRRQAIEKWTGLLLILAVGAIHLVTAPDQFNDATYKGLLFLANAAGVAVAAIGIWRSQQWGWLLGLAISAATAAGYVLSRTVGLPGLPADPNILEPLGIAAVGCELVFLAVAGLVILRKPAAPKFERQRQEARAA